LTEFHLHLVSDATGETLNALTHAVVAQFEGAEPERHLWSMVRSADQVHRILDALHQDPGIVLFTLVDPDVREVLQDGCQKLGIPCVPVLDPLLAAFGRFLGQQPRHLPGIQHALDSDYFQRIEAMGFCLAHDDGQSLDTIGKADIILVGVSRTSKTPTSVYLANRGLMVANVPFVPGVPLPPEIETADGPMVVGLTTHPDRLVQIRLHRLAALNEDEETDYVDIESIREEVAAARKIFSRNQWPVIDVSRRSIEETAAAILNLYNERQTRSRANVS
jgi:regulator of PEP synthase PpsR (kinase-PPPase family)